MSESRTCSFHPTSTSHSVRRMPWQCNCFDYFQLEKKRFSRGAKSSLTPRSSFGVIIPKLYLLSMLVKILPHKESKDNTYNLPDSHQPIGLDILSKCQEKLLSWRNWLLIGNHSHSFVWKKGQRFATTVMSNGCVIIWSTRLRKIIEKITILVNIGDQKDLSTSGR